MQKKTVFLSTKYSLYSCLTELQLKLRCTCCKGGELRPATSLLGNITELIKMLSVLPLFRPPAERSRWNFETKDIETAKTTNQVKCRSRN